MTNTKDVKWADVLRADYASWHKSPHEFTPTAGLHSGCATCGYGPGAYFHSADALKQAAITPTPSPLN